MTIVLRIVLLLAGGLLGPASFAAGFDCQKARTPTERAICADEKLSVADEVMSAAYPLLEDAGSTAVADEQRAWLRRRDACRADVACLRQAYQERLQAFRMREESLGEALVSCHGLDERVVITPVAAGDDTDVNFDLRVQVPARGTLKWRLLPTQRHLDCRFASGRLVRVMTDRARRYPYGECGAAPQEDYLYSVWVDKAKAIAAANLFGSCFSWLWTQVKTTVFPQSIRVCRVNTHEGEARCDEERLSEGPSSPDLEEFPDGPEPDWSLLGSIVVEHAGDQALCQSIAASPTQLPPGAETANLPWSEPSGGGPPTTLVSRFDLDNDGREETVVSIHHERRTRESSHLLIQRDDTAAAASPPLSAEFLRQHSARVLPHAWANCPGGWDTYQPEDGKWDDAGCRIPLQHYRPGGTPYAYDAHMLRLRPFRWAGQTYLLGVGPGAWHRHPYPTVVWKPRPDGSAEEVCVFREVVKQL